MNFLLVSSAWFVASSVWICTTSRHANQKPVPAEVGAGKVTESSYQNELQSGSLLFLRHPISRGVKQFLTDSSIKIKETQWKCLDLVS